MEMEGTSPHVAGLKTKEEVVVVTEMTGVDEIGLVIGVVTVKVRR